MSKLTALSIKFLAPKDKPYEVADIPGLFLRIHPSGKKVWKLNKSINKKRITKTLGEYPTIGIVEAREKVLALANDPFAKKGNTFKDVYENWLEYKKGTNKYWRILASRVERNLLPTLGSSLWTEITPLMVINAVKSNVPEGQRIDYYYAYIASMERFAVTLGIAGSLKLQALTSLAPRKIFKHQDTIPAEDLPVFFEELRHYMSLPLRTKRHLNAILMLFYTLLRANEAYSLKWEYIDLQNKVITIPAEQMKMRREHTIPITPQIEKLLEVIPKTGEYLFSPSFDNLGRARTMINSIAAIFKQLRINGQKLVPHGIRAMGRTWMAEQGIDFEVAENCLAHIVGNQVVQAYNRTTLLERRRVAMQKWDDYVESCFNNAMTYEQACNEEKNGSQ